MSGNTGGSPVTTKTQILLEPCKVDDWKDVGDNFEEQFNVFEMNHMLCMKSGQTMNMKGYEGSPDYSYLTLKVKTCTNNTY